MEQEEPQAPQQPPVLTMSEAKVSAIICGATGLLRIVRECSAGDAVDTGELAGCFGTAIGVALAGCFDAPLLRERGPAICAALHASLTKCFEDAERLEPSGLAARQRLQHEDEADAFLAKLSAVAKGTTQAQQETP